MLSVFPLIMCRGGTFYLFNKSDFSSRTSGSMIYGSIIGLLESIVITPFDAIKIPLQTNSTNTPTK